MSVLPVLQDSDPRLRRRSKGIVIFDSAEEHDIADLAEDMLETMRSIPGAIALAAPQVGVFTRMIVVSEVIAEYPLVLLNPVVTQTEGTDTKTEGCLSIPGAYIEVTRPERVWYEGRDVQGFPQSGSADGILARAIQHEIDHLDGILITQRSNQGKIYGRTLAPDRR